MIKHTRRFAIIVVGLSATLALELWLIAWEGGVTVVSPTERGKICEAMREAEVVVIGTVTNQEERLGQNGPDDVWARSTVLVERAIKGDVRGTVVVEQAGRLYPYEPEVKPSTPGGVDLGVVYPIYPEGNCCLPAQTRLLLLLERRGGSDGFLVPHWFRFVSRKRVVEPERVAGHLEPTTYPAQHVRAVSMNKGGTGSG